MARIKVEAGEACEHCGARILCAPGADNSRQIVAYNTIAAQVGDQVVVEEEDNLLLKMSVFQYGLPLVGFIGGIGLVYLNPNFRSNEIGLFIAGLIGLALGAGLSWLGVRRMARKPGHFLMITRIVN